ncbi:MOSC domain-containing protein [Paenibacillus abyssi]|uniref:MOSC domain-containing protein n=1 Tax=Paenibacillus abyssi TaxID=1340531 RepID=A0A917CK22_9BACL|nr:MOSC domain-containing protein [Paenibacillus abyssi]GGF90126.1 MOSC domain-containing protein [Paenibacillus abyssi]
MSALAPDLGTIISINVGQPVKTMHGNKEVETGIFKQPVNGVQWLSYNGLSGDGQADLVHHGGVDKAICVYVYDYYKHWERALGKKLEYSAFGENFTVSGGHERVVAIGDIYRIGSAKVQVSQPRMPCFKLSIKHGEPQLQEWVLNKGYTGFYFRVLEEGEVKAGDVFVCESKHPERMSVAEAAFIMKRDKKNIEAAKRLLAVKELSESWKVDLEKRLHELQAEIEEEDVI